ncbi:hypothetical protein [Ancrocorticia populi]|uniref:UmuC domain-containing protein n=1 Tax=Ancrocorticia populi TaxID=2175228 RepID=A0A2V1KBI0_9ACTO|nr:hypothetical protein [Ancrocorticia populi]PWF26688.1 hypothetical protein DD236_05205 [Ancrocorticia populi]
MKLSGSVWIPDWPVTAAEIAGDVDSATPAAVYGKRGILSANSWARREGITEGMRQRSAHSLSPHALLLPADPERESLRFEPVLRALDRHIANVTVVSSGSVLFTAAGAIKAAGSAELLGEEIIGEINDVAGCEALVGFGYGTLATLLAARDNSVVSLAETDSFIGREPLSSLLVAAPSEDSREDLMECLNLLERLGLRRLGEVRQLGRTALTTRFGKIGQLIWALVDGDDVHVAHRQEATPEFSVTRTFEPPLETTEQTVFAAKILADELGEEIVSRSLAGGRLLITASLMNGNELERAWLLDGGSVKDVVDRVRWQLGSWLSSGEDGSSIVRLSLKMSDLLPAGYRPQPLWGGQSVSEHQATKAALRLQSLLGEESIAVPYRVGSRIPSERYRTRAWNEAPDHEDQGELPWPGSIPEPPPCLLHTEPIAVNLLGACGHQLQVSGEGELGCPQGCAAQQPSLLRGRGGDIAITRFAGPWIIEQRWWDHPVRRAYLQVAGAGIGVLVYIENNEWKEEGRYV